MAFVTWVVLFYLEKVARCHWLILSFVIVVVRALLFWLSQTVSPK
jgi:hypothetical protein